MEITLAGNQLMLTVGGPKQPLTPLSLTEFATDDGALVEFFKNDKGAVTHLIAHIVEGDIKAVRKK